MGRAGGGGDIASDDQAAEGAQVEAIDETGIQQRDQCAGRAIEDRGTGHAAAEPLHG